ncbi:ataxin-10-like isoform X2 [Babylonia areolata]|uniref:ataxin-10-like isoform X2 n=1 Tax=Babylonia areolata TaxID=304850 RepID=UPI003FD5834E
MTQGDGKENYRYLLMDTFRILRNSCGASPKVQEHLGGAKQGSRLMMSTHMISDKVVNLFRGESLVQVLAVIIQFLYNLGVDMVANQDLVWDSFKGKLRTWLDMADRESEMDQEPSVKILNNSCAVVEVCLPRQWQRNERFLEDFTSFDNMQAVIQASSFFQFDFGKKAMLKLVQVPNLAKCLYPQLNPRERYFVCNCMKDAINEWRTADEKESEMPTLHSNLRFYAENVIVARPSLGVSLLAQQQSTNNVDLHHHVKMLEVMAVASCCREFAKFLSSIKLVRAEGPSTLAEYAIDFLKDIHIEGNRSSNMLSMVKSKNEVLKEHPAYQLRCDLVRLIGNLAFQNKEVQDLVREHDQLRGLPVIMEQTVIDERNPFLAEWAKLALSNLVRDNEESALFIHSLNLSNQRNGVGIMKGCGLVLEKEGDRIKIREEGSQYTLTRLSEKEPNRP